MDGIRLSIGPVHLMQYVLQGLFHPARRIRQIYWRIYNACYIGAQDAMVASYPNVVTTDEERAHGNNYERTVLMYTL